MVFEGERDREAQLLQPSDRPALRRGGDLFLGVARPQFARRLLVLEQVRDDNQDAVGQGDKRFLAAHALFKSLRIGSQKSLLAARSALGGLDERLTQPAIALACFGAQPFARTDLGRWTQARPGDQMALAGALSLTLFRTEARTATQRRFVGTVSRG